MIQAGPLRVRTFGPESGPSIILCHGYGAAGDDLVPLARATDAGPGTRWFFPEAPLEIDIGYDEPGRAWWAIDMMKLQMELARGGRVWDPASTPEGMTDAHDRLVETLRVLIRDHGVDPARTVLGGFSQGAMITTDVALTSDLGFNNLAILSGSHLRSDVWAAALEERGKSLHVMQSHGRSDPLLPFGIAEALHAALDAAGATTSFIPFQGGHEIRPVVLESLGRFARARLHVADVRQ